MKIGLRYALFGLLAFLVSLAFSVPADLGYREIKKRVRLPVQLELYGITGSWRAGRAAQVVVQGRRYTDFEWTIKLLPLLVGKMNGRFSLHQERGVFAGDLEVEGDKITITNALAQLPAEALQAYLPDFALRLSGEMKAVFESLQFTKGTLIAASGTVVCRGTQLLAAERLILGDLKAQFVTEANGVKVMLADGGGPLLLEGQILLKPDRSYSFTGAFAARDRKQPMLEDTLKFFGKPGPDGRISVAHGGRLPLLFP
jgi:hypothetical protein